MSKLATKATSSVLDKFERKISGHGAVIAGKGFTLFISKEDMTDIIKIIDSPEKSGVWINGATETVKHGIKKQEGGFLGAMMAPMAASLIASMASSFIQPVASSLINAITGKIQEGGFLPLLVLPLMKKAMSGKRVKSAGKRLRRARRVYNNLDKSFYFCPIL